MGKSLGESQESLRECHWECLLERVSGIVSGESVRRVSVSVSEESVEESLGVSHGSLWESLGVFFRDAPKGPYSSAVSNLQIR